MNFFGSAICSSACVLKICLINDVYELDCFPRYYNCRREEATKISILGGTEKAGCTIGLLAGDFLAPSLLSSIDKGVSMIDCMNRCNIDYVCIGNHESDVDLRQFHLRIKESRFTWLNSNIPYLPLPPDIPKLPEYKVIEFSNEDKTHTRRVALIGFATEDRSVMRPDAFSGCQIEAINEKARILYKKIMENEKVDAIIPMTHQLIHLDRDLARMNIGFPIILGGHDHEPYLETIGSSPACTIVKTGCDGKKFAICEICWPHTDATEPQISVVVRDADSYPADEGISSVINQHKTVLSELEKSVLFEIPSPSSSFSSVGIRRQPTSVGTYLCNIWRDSLKADCCVCPGGCIRAQRSYEGEESFTYAHLKSEIPFDTILVTCHLPGKVLVDMIQYTRAFALQSPVEERGGYLQTDDQITWDATSNLVLTMAGAPVDLKKSYVVALTLGLLDGLDNVEPLLQYKANCPSSDPCINRSLESGVKAKQVIIAHFSKVILFSIFKELSGFDALDLDHDGFISKEELLAALNSQQSRHGHDPYFTHLLGNNIFNIADINGDGCISIKEILMLSLSMIGKDVPTVHEEVHGERSLSDQILDIHEQEEYVLIQDALNETSRIISGRNNFSTHEKILSLVSDIGVSGKAGYVTKRNLEKFLDTLDLEYSKKAVI